MKKIMVVFWRMITTRKWAFVSYPNHTLAPHCSDESILNVVCHNIDMASASVIGNEFQEMAKEELEQHCAVYKTNEIINGK